MNTIKLVVLLAFLLLFAGAALAETCYCTYWRDGQCASWTCVP